MVKNCKGFQAFLLFGLLVCGCAAKGQTQPFPYNVQIQTVIGQCYDDNRIIITITDDNGNIIAVNPQTHNAVDLDTYPLYNIQYHYQNTSDATAVRYDTVNNIQVTNGMYCIGVQAYVPGILEDGSQGLVLVDTNICDVEVATTYEHLEASVLSMIARNRGDLWWVEDPSRAHACGLHPAYHCADIGRIQLQLTKGKFPYYVTLMDHDENVLRQVTYFQRVQNGEDSLLADYRDYYTFDSLAIGQYNIVVSDSCGYTLWLSIEVPNGDILYNDMTSWNAVNCIDSNVVQFTYNFGGNVQFHDYDHAYLNTILQYRFLNPGNEVTPWKFFPGAYDPDRIWDYWIYDTISFYHNYCPLYHDTLTVQIRNLCFDTVMSFSFYFIKDFDFQDLRVLSAQEGGTSVPDTCLVHVDSALATQSYSRPGTTTYCSWCGSSGGVGSTIGIKGRFYTCPISYNVYSVVDSTLLAHNESDDFGWLDAPLAIYADTVLPVHISVSDAQGCELNSYDTVFVFNVSEAGDGIYPWVTGSTYYDIGWNSCCQYYWDRYFWIQEKGVDYNAFRSNMEIRLIKSPLYNKSNFTAVRQNGEWTITPDDPVNFSLTLDFEEGDGWRVVFHDTTCLVPGLYEFVITTDCGADTISYKWTEDPYYYSYHTQDAQILYDTMQICNKYYLYPYDGGFVNHRVFLDADVDNDNPYEEIESWGFWGHVVDGVAGGYNEYPNSDGYFVFTIPGDYVIEYVTYWDNCTQLSVYDTVTYSPVYLDFDRGFALLCDYQSQSGVVLSHAINGSTPYEYYLYAQPDMLGDVIGTSADGYFSDVPMHEGQFFSVMVSDSCHNSFYINLTATSLSQNVMAWEFGDNVGMPHCEGDSTSITALPFSFQADYHWTGPNGFESDSRQNTVYLPYGGESGWYVVEILNTGCQTTVTDSVYVEIAPAPRVTILSEPAACPGMDATLGFAVEGYGNVTYDIHHVGDPASGFDSFVTPSGDTLYHAYPIMSENVFWADNISDERCTYGYIIDSVTVDLVSPSDFAPVEVNTTGGMACYNHAINLYASANLSYPYYVCWYESPRQAQLLKCDTIWQPGTQSSCQIEHLVSDSALYVSVSNNERCGGAFGAIYQWLNMSNGSTTVPDGEGVRLFDSGGESSPYGNNEQFTHTFYCPGGNQIWLQLHAMAFATGDTLYIYSGNTTNADSLILAQSNGTFPPELTVHSHYVTLRFRSNATVTDDGWVIDILTGIPMTPAFAQLAPQMYDTIAAVLCPSTTPFIAEGFAPFDVSQPVEYLIDTLLLTEDGCQIVTHLHVVVNEASDTSLYLALMPCRLPYQWNGVTFQDYGTRVATLSNRFNCDSVITMTVAWAPPVDSTDVFDTIVENQLPYTTNGLQFTADGVQIATLTTHDGCDSIVTVHVYVHYNVAAEVDSIICDDALPFVWNGATFTGSGTQVVTIPAHTGADSVLTMNLTVFPTSLTVLYDTICQREEYHNYDFNLSSSETAVFGPATFTHTLPNQYGCDSLVRLELLITPDVTPEFVADPDKVLLSEGGYIPFFNQTDITDLAGMNYYWVWDFGDGMSDTTTEYNVDHTYMQWGDYEVTLTLMVNDCETNVSHMVYVEADLRFPNVITPNGDGVNDVFAIENLNPERSSEIVIVDRWGKVVYHEKNYQTYMRDGQIYNPESGFGSDPSILDGVYYYTFYYQGIVRIVEFHGSITVVR